MLAMLAMLMALNALAIDIMLPALPAIASDLKITVANHRQYIISAYLGGMATGPLIYGPLIDRFGRKVILKIVLGAYIAMALGSALATDFPVLIASRFGHGFAGGAMGVIVVATLRDLFSGDALARRLSMVFMLFMLVPMIAPALGAIVEAFVGWRAVFLVLALSGAAMLLWTRSLAETLDPANVRAMNWANMLASWKHITLHRRAVGYMTASGVTQGALFGWLNSSEQLIADVFNARALFPLIFALIALGLAAASWSNARIVERFGARRVSQFALFVFLILATGQLMIAIGGYEILMLFTFLMAINIGLIGFIGANFGAIALEDFSHMAGTASSLQTFVRVLIAALVGLVIGQIYDRSTLPIAFSFVGCAAISIALVLWAERGRLFTRSRLWNPDGSPQDREDDHAAEKS